MVTHFYPYLPVYIVSKLIFNILTSTACPSQKSANEILESNPAILCTFSQLKYLVVIIIRHFYTSTYRHLNEFDTEKATKSLLSLYNGKGRVKIYGPGGLGTRYILIGPYARLHFGNEPVPLIRQGAVKRV